MTAPLSLLIVEESADYATIVQGMLRDAMGAEVEVVHCASLASARELLFEREADCVLLELGLPDATGLEALQGVQVSAPEVPVVVLTGSDDMALAVQAVREGAQDFLVKRSADRDSIARSVHYAIERKRAAVKLSHQALHDSLTGLPNRVLLADRLDVALARGGRKPTSLALLFLDLDGFKAVNDTHGHDAGDELLVEIADRLRQVLRPGDTVARFGGDEFLILCEELHGEREAVRVAERARATVAEPVHVGGKPISVRATVGIAYGGSRSPDAPALIRAADAAMYRARRYGNGIELADANLHAEAMNELQIEHQLRGALARGELRLHFQPELSLSGDRRVLGLETLVRWQHPERGLLMPAAFLSLAEETGLIVGMGEWVLALACGELARWRSQGLVGEGFTVSVNLSSRELVAPGLCEAASTALDRAGIPPRCLRLEVSESCLVRDPGLAGAVLDRLKAIGVGLTLDDFGAGVSSLTALTTFPLDVVKLDGAFTAELGPGRATRPLVEAVLGVVHATGQRAVAEGIERQDQLDALRSMGCDGGQGFLFAPPVPVEEAAPWLRSLGEAGLRPRLP